MPQEYLYFHTHLSASVVFVWLRIGVRFPEIASINGIAIFPYGPKYVNAQVYTYMPWKVQKLPPCRQWLDWLLGAPEDRVVPRATERRHSAAQPKQETWTTMGTYDFHHQDTAADAVKLCSE